MDFDLDEFVFSRQIFTLVEKGCYLSTSGLTEVRAQWRVCTPLCCQVSWGRNWSFSTSAAQIVAGKSIYGDSQWIGFKRIFCWGHLGIHRVYPLNIIHLKVCPVMWNHQKFCEVPGPPLFWDWVYGSWILGGTGEPQNSMLKKSFLNLIYFASFIIILHRFPSDLYRYRLYHKSGCQTKKQIINTS